MPIGGKLRLLKGVLYRLKRSYGCQLAVYKTAPQQVDLETGRAHVERFSIELKRAIVLPSQIHRGFNYDIGYLKANSNFTYGGIYTDATRVVIIDAADLPKDFGLTASDNFYVVYDGNRWEIKTVEKLEFGLGYIVTLERIAGAINDQIINMTVRQRMQFHQYVSFDDGTAQSLCAHDRLEFIETVIVQAVKVHHQTVSQQLIFQQHTEEQ